MVSSGRVGQGRGSESHRVTHRGRRIAGAVWALLALWAPAAPAGAGQRAADSVKEAGTYSVDLVRVTYGFEPNDPYFHKDTPVAGFPGQWHLVNEHAAGLDIGVAGAWARGLTGQGVMVAVVDDCLETTHEDLAPNYDPANSWDFGQGDGTPDPVNAIDGHGVSTAGLLAARGGNGLGVTGVAPYASLAGLRIDFLNQSVQDFVDATLYHSSGANTSVKIKSHSYGVRNDYVPTPQESNAVELSASHGTIHCWAAGNDAHDVNKKDLQNQPAAIAAAALGSDGTYAGYSNYGAALFVAVPSSSSGGLYITTTDRAGETYGYNTSAEDPFPDADYTSRFSGTSACAPQLAGVLALAKQAQPALDGRFAKHLLARTCRIVDPTNDDLWSDGGWRPNAAGYWFNQNYGFGLLDANALTRMATQYTGVSPLQTETTPVLSVDRAVPDNDANGILRTFGLTATTPLEDLLVTIDITHTYHGDIEIHLTSPSGTTSRLVKGQEVGRGQDTHQTWTYCSNVFWGEDPNGTWSIRLADIWSVDTGTWNWFQVTARMGTLVPEPGTVGLLALAVPLALGRRRRRG